MHKNGIAGVVWSAFRRLTSVPAGIRATITALAAAAILAGAPTANASVEYDYTGADFTGFFGDAGLYTTANSVTGDFIFSSPLTPSTQNNVNLFGNGTSSLMSFSVSDQKNTISSTSPNVAISGVIDTNAADQITHATIDVTQSARFPSTQSEQISISPTGDSGSLSNGPGVGGGGRSLIGGMWSGAVATPTSGCTSQVQNAVTAHAGGNQSLLGLGPYTSAIGTFTPPVSMTYAAIACGFDNFNWQSTITALPGQIPPDLYQNTSPPIPVKAPLLDPPLGGYVGTPQNDYPFYYDNAGLAQVINNGVGQYSITPQHGLPLAEQQPLETENFLNFVDTPGDSLLPIGSYITFTTCLVGNIGGVPVALPASDNDCFNWESDYNGLTGGVNTLSDSGLSDQDGSGGVMILSNGVNDVPEPSSLAILVAALTGLPWIGHRRTGRSMKVASKDTLLYTSLGESSYEKARFKFFIYCCYTRCCYRRVLVCRAT